VKFAKKKVAVTGAAGFIGRYVVESLRGGGALVDEWDVAHVARPIDLEDAGAVRRRLEQEPPEAIIHLAARGVRHSAAHDPECIGHAVRMVATLIQATRDLDLHPRLVVAGSMAEYGHVPSPLREDSPCLPNTAYAIAKLAATRYALAYGARAESSVCVARLFGVYGRGEAPGRLFPTLMANLNHRIPVPLSDGRQVRDFIHVSDVARVLAELTFADCQGVVNVCTGVGVGVGDAARWIADSLGADPSLLRFGAVPRSPGDQDLLVGDPTRLESSLGWRPPQRIAPGLDASAILDKP
jgi:GDP-4-dehydro-6-deoxy-D-mannose reductase